MRPLRMELRGFTAFRDPTEMDFTKLDVFAISGPTGSGKSSLLDAMTYALYGRVERVGDRVGQLVSQGQPRMAVTLEFEVGTERYRVTRSTPSGKGATKILLERFADDEWTQAGDGADRVRDAEKMLTRAIGLTYDGFTRSVLLPQGKFAEFMVGDAKKRRDILTELLGLSLFRRMAERAGALGKEATVRADTMAGMLEHDYAEATPEALKEARASLQEAKKREKALTAASKAVEAIVARWVASKRSAEELLACAVEAARAAEATRAAVEELAGLVAVLRESEPQMFAAEARAQAAAEAVVSAGAAVRAADASLGTAEDLAEIRVTAHRLAEAASVRSVKERERTQAAQAAAALAKALEEADARTALARGALQEHERLKAAAETALEDARHADLVAAVSAGLKAGDPCPVCGLPLAKAPKRAVGGGVAKAGVALDAAKRNLESARAELADDERTGDGLRRELAANADDQTRLTTELQDMDSLIADGRAVLGDVLGPGMPDDPVAEIDRRLAERKRLDQGERDAMAGAAAAERELATAKQERDRLTAAAHRQRDRLAADYSPLFDRVSRASDGEIPAPALPAAPSDESAAELVLEAWGSVADTLSAYQDRVTKEADLLSAADRAFVEEALTTVGDLIEPADTLEALAASIQEAGRSARADVATSAKDVDDIAARLDRRKELVKEIGQLETRSRLFKALALELRADRLIAFLQAEALQVLAASGSDRLASLSDGRYRLACREDEFFVVDTWNGDDERSVRTLSGGETFLASLALALALADQVRSLSVTDRARLDSLFLDEGFGTLDPESLRTVVEAIEQLAGDGRLVGVITHVQDLAEQFPRIEVHKDRIGSKLEVVA